MKYFYSPKHIQHRSPFEVFNGDHDTAQEVPERAVQIKKSLDLAGHKMSREIEVVPDAILYRVHSPAYLSYLKKRCHQLANQEYLYPSVRPYCMYSTDQHPGISDIALRGSYIFDTYTPLLRHTYEAALASSSLAYSSAKALLRDPSFPCYALCRPPGHHAEHAQAGGYCYINNAAIAAETLSAHGMVAIIDVDFHHGNGTQHIFYQRSDVLTVSIHADPLIKFPFYSGFTDEVGSGPGAGYNANIPLPLGTDDATYDRALAQALEIVRRSRPNYIIIAFGADTHVADPIGGFRLSTAYFQQMGAHFQSLDLPTLIVQEGGYNNQYLGTNVVSFLSGFEKNI
ncbi:MAG: histone deacetylase family protein [Candidatus Roizmanbacteria bacterium]